MDPWGGTRAEGSLDSCLFAERRIRSGERITSEGIWVVLTLGLGFLVVVVVVLVVFLLVMDVLQDAI